MSSFKCLCALPTLSLFTCMSIVGDGLDDMLRGEVDEGKVVQVRVGLDIASGDVDWRLPFVKAKRGDVSPVGWSVIWENQRCSLRNHSLKQTKSFIRSDVCPYLPQPV